MKRVVTASVEDQEKKNIQKVYADMKKLVDDIEDLTEDSYNKMELSDIYALLLDSIQDNYKYAV